MRRRVLSTLVLAVIVVAGAACSSDEPKTGATTPSAVTMQGFLFKPSMLSVEAGNAVVWTNRDDIAHTVTSGSPGAVTMVFDSGDKTRGQAFTHTFGASGTFDYFCKNHNGMTGSVTVT